MQDKSVAGAVLPKAQADVISMETLIDGAQKACGNAEALFGEAQLLNEHGAHARALCLHQISLEECSKVEYLGAWAMSLLLGKDVDQKQIRKAFGSHAAKNKLNAYMLEASDEELAAREKGDWKGATEAFKKTQDAFHQFSNSNKNAALYVDWTGAAFVAPGETITADLAAEIGGLNARFLQHAQLGMRMFARVQNSSDVLTPLLSDLVAKMEKLRAEKPEDLIDGADAALTEFLEAGLERFGKE